MVIAPARRAGDLGSNPGPGENFSLKLLISTCQLVILKAKIIYIYFRSVQMQGNRWAVQPRIFAPPNTGLHMILLLT